MDAVLEFLRSPWGGAAAFGVLTVWPMWRTMVRAGFSAAWALLVFVPVFGLPLALAVLALRRWPALSVKD